LQEGIVNPLHRMNQIMSEDLPPEFR